ncbi:MAG: SprT family zinc-dependent metalloprotease [Polaromonas sp.]
MMQKLLQFTLDLFEPAPEKPVKSIEKADFQVSNQPPGQQIRARPAPDNVADDAALPTQTLQQALAPATFAHPRASRDTLLDGIAVAYEFKRGKRRTIGFSVGAQGLTVSAPKWVPLYEIDKAVLEKQSWIIKKLQETRARHDRLESARIDWKDGTTLPFLGEQVIVVLDPRHAFGGVGAELKSSTDTLPGVTHLTLHVGLPHTATPDQIKDAVQAWLMRQAKRIFTERLNHFAPTLKVQWRKLSLSSAGTRWGSASADGSIRLNWRLIHFKQSVIDYVVVHELSHLRVMDHSPRFWDTVRAVVPDYAALRSQLKDEGAPRW